MTFEELLEKDGQLIYTNKGVSMMPLLREDRDIMVIRKKGSEPCCKLDAVLFKRPGIIGRGAYVLHRILKVNNDGTYWVVGDNCTSGEIVAEKQILGILRTVVRNGKTISVNNRGYRVYVNTWCRWYRLRFFVLRTQRFILRRLGWLKRKVFR